MSSIGPWARRHRLALALAAVLVVAILSAMYAIAQNIERVGSRVDPSTKHGVTTYRLFDAVEIEVSEPTNSAFDLANALVLAALSGVALTAAALAHASQAVTRHQRRFFVIAWLAAAYLALDEALELNETYSYNLEGLGRLRDLDLVAYGVPGLAFAYVFRDVLFASRRALLLAAAGLVAFALAQILDAFVGRLHGIEERFEPVSSLAFVAAFLVLAVEQLRPSGAATASPAAALEARVGPQAGERPE